MRDIARLANVSVSAVSLVVRDKPGVAPETRERIQRIMAQLGYTTSTGSNGEKPMTIGLMIERSSMPVIFDVFYGDIIRGIQSEARRLGYQVLLHIFDREAEGMESLRASVEGKVRGLVIANDGDITPELVVQLESIGVPLVLVESYVPGHRLPCILGDNFTAGYTAMRHLLDLGHRRIAVLGGPRKYSSLTDRLKGCLAAAAEAGLLIPAELMPPPVHGHPQKGYLQMREVLQLAQLPTGVVAISDKTAFGAMEAIKEAGLRIPHDIAIVSIDDVDESAYARPPLTTVHIPRLEMGTLAMQKLHRLITNDAEIPVKSVVYGELVVRESCGAASGSQTSIAPGARLSHAK
ncbi:MAG: substrate-binding domain-containing protein [Chloroflexota bacterium]